MKKQRAYPHIILFVISMLILAVAFCIRPTEITKEEFIYDAVLNFGYIVITIVIVNGLWFLLGGDPINNAINNSIDRFLLLSDSEQNGLYRFFSSNSHFSQHFKWTETLRHAERHVYMMGYSLHAWTKNPSIKASLINLAKKNVKIRLMVMDTSNPHFMAGLNLGLNSFTEQYMKDEVSFCRKFVNDILDELPSDKKSNIEIRTIKKGLTECQIIIVDDRQYITPYLYSQNTDSSPLFIINRTGDSQTFNTYNSEFEMLWNDNK